MIATSYMLLFKLNLIKNKLELNIQFFSGTSHILSTQWLPVDSGYDIGWHKYRAFSSSQKFLLDSILISIFEIPVLISHIMLSFFSEQY